MVRAEEMGGNLTKRGIIASDLQCGSIYGMLPPNFETSEDGIHKPQNPGQEYLWPNLNQGLPFAPLQGRVLSATSAEYAMPFMGLVCPCVTHLDRVKDEILLENSWMKLVFRL